MKRGLRSIPLFLCVNQMGEVVSVVVNEYQLFKLP